MAAEAKDARAGGLVGVKKYAPHLFAFVQPVFLSKSSLARYTVSHRVPASACIRSELAGILYGTCL